VQLLLMFYIPYFFFASYTSQNVYWMLLQLLSAATFFGAIFCFSAFCFTNMYAFLAFFSVGELLVFATQVCAYWNYLSRII
jgi:hypothetical protein